VEARYREGDGPGCLDALAEILRDDPDLSIAWYLQGLLAARFGNADAFEQSWQYMTRQERAWPALLMIRGEHLLRDGQTSAGLSLYEKAFDLNPYDSRIVWQVAVAEFTHGSPVHAERYVTQLLSLEPGNPWGNFALGAIQFSRGNYDLAESSLRVASERLDIPDAENNLAWLLHLNGRHEEAEAHARAALALDDQFAPAWDTLGAIQMQGGDRAGARTAYRRALELDPVSWDARVHLAQLAWAEGRELEAAKLVRELEPDSLGKSSPELADYRALRHELRMPVMTSE